MTDQASNVATLKAIRWVSGKVGVLGLLGLLLLVPGSVLAKDSRGGAVGAQLDFGTKMAQRGLWNEALFRFRQAELLEPDNIHAIGNVAVALEAVGKFDDALVAYQRALKVDPSNLEVKRNYGRFAEFYQSYKGKPKTTDTPKEAAPTPKPGGAGL
ncbi:MAG: tetratricopeptide repeat protein [Acidobacteriota bacterium]